MPRDEWGFQVWGADQKIILSSKTLYYQIVDSFVVSSADGNGSKTLAGFNNIKVHSIFSKAGCICATSVTGNTVNWSWSGWQGSPCTNNNAEAIIYVYSV